MLSEIRLQCVCSIQQRSYSFGWIQQKQDFTTSSLNLVCYLSMLNIELLS